MTLRGGDVNELEAYYFDAAKAYAETLCRYRLAKWVSQSRQQVMTVQSFAHLRAMRPDVQMYSELLVQDPVGGDVREIGRVVPDCMVVLQHETPTHMLSFDYPFQNERPTMVFEFICPANPRKDYDDNFRRYERDLGVPYYPRSEPETATLTLFRLGPGRKYERAAPNGAGRFEVPELDLEAAVVDGWVRYWYRGKQLLLPAELKRA